MSQKVAILKNSLLSLALSCLLVSPAVLGDTLLVGNKSEASVSFVDLETGREVGRAKTDPGPHEIAVSGDGTLAVVTNYGTSKPGNTLTVIEVERGESVGTIDLGENTRPHGIVFMPGNRRVLVTAEGAKVLLQVDVWQGVVEKAIPTGQDVSHMLAYDPDGERAYVSNMGSASVSLINVSAGELLAFRSTGAGAEGIALADNGRDLWVTNRNEDTVSLLDSRYLEAQAKLSVPGFPIRAEVMPRRQGGKVLVTSARSAELTIIDPVERKVERTLPISLKATSGTILGNTGESSVPIGIEIDPSGKRVWIAHAAADSVQELDAGNWQQTRVFKVGDEPDAMAYSPLSVTGASSGE
jgi:DNA-binding beta-propeller fold protein YncE